MRHAVFLFRFFVLATLIYTNAQARSLCNDCDGQQFRSHTVLKTRDTFPFTYTPYFFALIVHKMDSSERWYCSLFGLNVAKRMNEAATGFNVSILESSSLVIELIENKTSIALKDILADKPEGTKIEGLFKAGFHIDDVDAWLKHLSSLKISVGKIYKDASGKRNFLIQDPDGNLIQFFE